MKKRFWKKIEEQETLARLERLKLKNVNKIEENKKVIEGQEIIIELIKDTTKRETRIKN